MPGPPLHLARHFAALVATGLGVGVLLLPTESTAQAPCNRSCDASQRDAYGCCPAAAQRRSPPPPLPQPTPACTRESYPYLAVVAAREIRITRAVAFETGTALVRPESFCTLDAVTAALSDNPVITLDVEGHTDNVGDAAQNKALSQARADAVRSYLVVHGIEAARLRAVGYGMERPLASNGTETGRSINRRVELHRTEPAPSSSAPVPPTEQQVCDGLCARFATCGFEYTHYCAQHCASGPVLRACATPTSDCAALAVCAEKQWAVWNCGGIGGYAGYTEGHASCEQTSACEGTCAGNEMCLCNCRGKADVTKATPIVRNETCYLEHCFGRCDTPGNEPCTACWTNHCGPGWARSCKGN